MTDKEFIRVREIILKRLHEDKSKELHCHIQFVVKVGMELVKKYDGDAKIIELSCLLHDIGRDHEVGDEDHGDAGARIAAKLLETTTIPQKEVAVILDCIRFHNKRLPSYTLEQQIVITADSASKVLYHEAFMLLCKKTSYEEKLRWGNKYLEKGYHNTVLPEYKQAIERKYKEIKKIYDAIPALSGL